MPTPAASHASPAAMNSPTYSGPSRTSRAAAVVRTTNSPNKQTGGTIASATRAATDPPKHVTHTSGPYHARTPITATTSDTTSARTSSPDTSGGTLLWQITRS